jgi:hypothetical protein
MLEGACLHPGRGRTASVIVRFARTRREAEAAIETAVEAALVNSDVPIRRSMIPRPDSRLSSRTIADYTWTWATYVEARTSSLRGHP